MSNTAALNRIASCLSPPEIEKQRSGKCNANFGWTLPREVGNTLMIAPANKAFGAESTKMLTDPFEDIAVKCSLWCVISYSDIILLLKNRFYLV